MKPDSDRGGAVLKEDCPRHHYGKCLCGTCDVCGYAKHMGVHGPLYGQPAGSKPWGHEFKPRRSQP